MNNFNTRLDLALKEAADFNELSGLKYALISRHPHDTDIITINSDLKDIIQKLNATNPQPLQVGGMSIKVKGRTVNIYSPKESWVLEAIDAAQNHMLTPPYAAFLQIWAGGTGEGHIKKMSKKDQKQLKTLVQQYAPDKYHNLSEVIYDAIYM